MFNRLLIVVGIVGWFVCLVASGMADMHMPNARPVLAVGFSLSWLSFIVHLIRN